MSGKVGGDWQRGGRDAEIKCRNTKKGLVAMAVQFMEVAHGLYQ